MDRLSPVFVLLFLIISGTQEFLRSQSEPLNYCKNYCKYLRGRRKVSFCKCSDYEQPLERKIYVDNGIKNSRITKFKAITTATPVLNTIKSTFKSQNSCSVCSSQKDVPVSKIISKIILDLGC